MSGDRIYKVVRYDGRSATHHSGFSHLKSSRTRAVFSSYRPRHRSSGWRISIARCLLKYFRLTVVVQRVGREPEKMIDQSEVRDIESQRLGTVGGGMAYSSIRARDNAKLGAHLALLAIFLNRCSTQMTFLYHQGRTISCARCSLCHPLLHRSKTF